MKAKLTGLVEFGSGGLNGATLTVFDSGVHAGAVLRRPRRLHHRLPQRGRRASPRHELAEGGAEGAADGRGRAHRRRLRRRRTRRASTRSSASCRPSCWSSPAISLFVGDLHHHQHLLDPGRPAQPRARPAAGHGRLAPPGQPVGARSRRSRSGCSGRPSGLGVGYLLALGLRWLFGVFGLDLSRADFPMTWHGGVLVATSSAWVSRRSPRSSPPAAPPGSPPIAALRDDVALPESSHAATCPRSARCWCWSAPVLDRRSGSAATATRPCSASAAASCSSSSACP